MSDRGNWAMKSLALNNRASISVVILWTILLLGIVAMGISFRARLYVKAMQTLNLMRIARFYAENAIEKARMVVSEDNNMRIDSFNDIWACGIDEEELVFKEICGRDICWDIRYEQDGQIIYGVTDLDRYFNLRTMPYDMLLGALKAAGADDDLAQEMANAFLDYTDFDEVARAGGDEPDGMKNGPVLNVEELWRVPIFSKHKRVTLEFVDLCAVRDGDWLVNVNTAPKGVLRGLFLSVGADRQEADGLSEVIVEYRRGSDNEVGTDDDRFFSSIDITGHLLGKGDALNARQRSLLSSIEQKIKVSSSVFCAKIIVYDKHNKSRALLNVWGSFTRGADNRKEGRVIDWGEG